MTDYSDRTKHDVVMGTKENGALANTRIAGHALNFLGTSYFLLKLWERPKDTYFVAKNRDDEANYTVFAKRIEDGSTVRFQNPVGYARLRDDLKTHLEVV